MYLVSHDQSSLPIGNFKGGLGHRPLLLKNELENLKETLKYNVLVLLNQVFFNTLTS